MNKKDEDNGNAKNDERCFKGHNHTSVSAEAEYSGNATELA